MLAVETVPSHCINADSVCGLDVRLTRLTRLKRSHASFLWGAESTPAAVGRPVVRGSSIVERLDPGSGAARSVRLPLGLRRARSWSAAAPMTCLERPAADRSSGGLTAW
jgi:hypothetical protein